MILDLLSLIITLAYCETCPRDQAPAYSVSDKGTSLRLKPLWCLNLTFNVNSLHNPSQAFSENMCHTHGWPQQKAIHMSQPCICTGVLKNCHGQILTLSDHPPYNYINFWCYTAGADPIFICIIKMLSIIVCQSWLSADLGFLIAYVCVHVSVSALTGIESGSTSPIFCHFW